MSTTEITVDLQAATAEYKADQATVDKLDSELADREAAETMCAARRAHRREQGNELRLLAGKKLPSTLDSFDNPDSSPDAVREYVEIRSRFTLAEQSLEYMDAFEYRDTRKSTLMAKAALLGAIETLERSRLKLHQAELFSAIQGAADLGGGLEILTDAKSEAISDLVYKATNEFAHAVNAVTKFDSQTAIIRQAYAARYTWGFKQ